MCGVWGFAGDRPDERMIRLAAVLAARRGPDAYGWAGQRKIVHRLGGIDENGLAELPHVDGPIIGHFRLATVGGGSATRLEDVQPIRAGGWTVAHNGTVPRCDQIAEQFSFSYDTLNDSEALAHLAGRYCSIGRAVVEAKIERYAVLALSPDGRLIALRRHMPLWRADRREGSYFSSGKLPGSKPIPEGE